MQASWADPASLKLKCQVSNIKHLLRACDIIWSLAVCQADITYSCTDQLTMDYQGQKAAELLLTRVMIAFAAAGFLIGYVLSNFAVMCYINVAGLAVALLLVVPDWPFLNKQPLQWLPPLNPGKQKKDEDVSTPQQQQQQQEEAQQQLTQAIKPSRSRKV